MKKMLLAAGLLLVCLRLSAQFTPDFPQVRFVDWQSGNRAWFVRCAQFQTFMEYVDNEDNGLVLVKDPAAYRDKVLRCLEIARENKVNLLIFPEMSLSLPDGMRLELISALEAYSRENDAIIIAGTYFNSERYSKNAVILPDRTVETYKIRPSIYEVNPEMGKGMVGGDTLFVFRTKYGNFLPLVCVDLISDDANFLARSLSNRGLIDMLININYNPKSQEFMREASAISVRHPLFVSVTNITLFQKGSTYDGDEFGNTSLFGSINNDRLRRQLLKNIPDFYKTLDKKAVLPAYKSLLGIIPPEVEGALIYDLNLRVIRTPRENNAPDQGYPTVKNIKVVKLSEVLL